MLELDDCVVLLSVEAVDISVFCLEDTVYFTTCLLMDYLQPGMKRRRIYRGTDDVADDKQVATAVNGEYVIPVAQNTTPLSNSSFSNPSAILSEAQKFCCRKHADLYQEIQGKFETKGVLLEEEVELVLTDPPYNF